MVRPTYTHSSIIHKKQNMEAMDGMNWQTVGLKKKCEVAIQWSEYISIFH